MLCCLLVIWARVLVHTQVCIVVMCLAMQASKGPARVLPITSDALCSLVQPGDTVYVGRYLASGAPEQGSLFLRCVKVGERFGRLCPDARVLHALSIYIPVLPRLVNALPCL